VIIEAGPFLAFIQAVAEKTRDSMVMEQPAGVWGTVIHGNPLRFLFSLCAIERILASF
jgi:hypothetical protein